MDRDKELRHLKTARKHMCKGASLYPISCRICPHNILKGQEYYAKSGGYEWHVTCVERLNTDAVPHGDKLQYSVDGV